MSTQHRKPLAAFVVLAFLMAGVVGVQKADAQAGRLLAAAVGAGVRVEGALPEVSGPEARVAAAGSVAGPAFAALADPASVQGPAGWVVAEVLPAPAEVVGREVADVAARWAPRDGAVLRASAHESRAHESRADAGEARADARETRVDARETRVDARADARARGKSVSARSARAKSRPAIVAVRHGQVSVPEEGLRLVAARTQPARVVPPAPKAPHPAPGQLRSWRPRAAAAADRGTRSHRHGHAHGSRHGHGPARGGLKAAARR